MKTLIELLVLLGMAASADGRAHSPLVAKYGGVVVAVAARASNAMHRVLALVPRGNDRGTQRLVALQTGLRFDPARFGAQRAWRPKKDERRRCDGAESRLFAESTPGSSAAREASGGKKTAETCDYALPCGSVEAPMIRGHKSECRCSGRPPFLIGTFQGICRIFRLKPAALQNRACRDLRTS